MLQITEKDRRSLSYSVELSENENGPSVKDAQFECAIALNACCGHVTGLLYQLAKFKVLGVKALPEGIAKTLLPQTFHIPCGPKISGKAVQDLDVSGYSKVQDPSGNETESKTLKSTLYNAVRGKPTDWGDNYEQLANADPDLLVLPLLRQPAVIRVPTKFGPAPSGSVLSYQQKMHDDFIINVVDGVGFPELPVQNVMVNDYTVILDHTKDVKLQGLYLNYADINKFEEKTRLQSQNPLWFKLRQHRITASQIGRIYKRRKDDQSLVKQLKSTRRVVTAAMKRGIASEPIAARKYSNIKEERINLYPCGLVISHMSPWVSASPDRKVYDPKRNPPFGLLEIKCPQVTSVLEAACLRKDANIKKKP